MLKNLFLSVVSAYFIFMGIGVLEVQANDIEDLFGAVRDRWGYAVDDIKNDIRGSGRSPFGEFEVESYKGDFSTIGENTSARALMVKILNFILSFVGIVAVAMVIYAGVLYVTSMGEDAKMESAKKILIYAAIGIVVVLASFAFVNTIIQNAGTGGQDRGESVTTSTGALGADRAGSVVGVLNAADGTISPLIYTDDLPSSVAGLSDGLTILGDGVVDYGGGFMISRSAAIEGVDIVVPIGGKALITFGDGSQEEQSGDSIVFSHAYGAEGAYNIGVAVEVTGGQIYLMQTTLKVGGVKALISPINNNELLVNEQISLHGSGSSTDIGSIIEYSWSCSGGIGCFPDYEGETLTVFFGEAGNYTTTLTVTTSLGATGTTSVDIGVLGSTPVAKFIWQPGGDSLHPAQFTFDASDSLNIRGNNSGLTYTWDFAGQTQTSTEPIAIHEFTTTGSQSASLIVSENVGGRDVVSDKFVENIDVATTIGVDFSFR